MEPSTNNAVMDAAQPFLDAGVELQQLNTALEILRQKKQSLRQELGEIDERLVTSERSRPALLEAVLSGAQQESVLTEQELAATQLGAERKSKSELLALIDRQLEEKSAKKEKARDRRERMREPIFRAIQRDLVESPPEGFWQHLKELACASAYVPGRRDLQAVFEETVRFGPDDHRVLVEQLFERYGIAE
ncbi:MAG: hypothetical protein R3B95_20675 [Nitrospirales bacterium]|nr:hypothetical protein [Nitrospirales bacterium]